MAQQYPQWRPGISDRAWLALLVETFELVQRPELRAVRCDDDVLLAVLAQLARSTAPADAHQSTRSQRN